MSLQVSLSEYMAAFQGELFPALEESLGPLPARYERFVLVLEFVLVDAVVLPTWPGGRGRPPEDRRALARAFLAKAVFDVPTTRALIERLRIDGTLRRLCGWTRAGSVPSEATFSRAFAAFAASGLPERLHAALVAKTLGHRLVGHISRDSTAIPAREKATPKPPPPPKRKRGRPRKGEEPPPKRRRLERQQEMTLAEMLADLPQACDVGTKRNAKGYKESWVRQANWWTVAGCKSRQEERVTTTSSVNHAPVAARRQAKRWGAAGVGRAMEPRELCETGVPRSSDWPKATPCGPRLVRQAGAPRGLRTMARAETVHRDLGGLSIAPRS